MIKLRHEKWIKTTLKLAKKSRVYRYKHAAILVKGGKIIGYGINNNKRKGKTKYDFYECRAFHAELDILSKFKPEEIKNAILYVAGINKNNKVVLSKPCKHCQQLISMYNLKAVYYCDENGNVNQL